MKKDLSFNFFFYDFVVLLRCMVLYSFDTMFYFWSFFFSGVYLCVSYLNGKNILS